MATGTGGLEICSRRGAKTAISAAACGAALFAALATAGLIGGFADNGRNLISLSSPRVVVLKSKRVLHLFDGERLLRTYPIDLGNSPVGPKLFEADGRTPVGRYHVVTKNADSPNHRFLGLDYPNDADARRGLEMGLVSLGESVGISRAVEEGRCPNWRTALGGGIGIHGRRRGEDWTAGCIAVADEHVEELFSVLRIGDPVEILP